MGLVHRVIAYIAPLNNYGEFCILSRSFDEALVNIKTYLDASFGSGTYDILGIDWLEDINIVNYLNDPNEGLQIPSEEFHSVICPNCHSINSYPNGMTEIKCLKCRQNIVIEIDEKPTEIE